MEQSYLDYAPLVIRGHADGGADEARLLEPRGLAVDVRRQRVYVAELHAIRAVDLCSGAVETLAGAEDEGDADGPGSYWMKLLQDESAELVSSWDLRTHLSDTPAREWAPKRRAAPG